MTGIMNNMRIAIIDSGLPCNYTYNNTVNGFSVVQDTNIDSSYRIIKDNCEDEIGHGTAIVTIFDKFTCGNIIDMYKIFSESFETCEEKLLSALYHIESEQYYDLIHISSGIIQPDNYNALYTVCENIAQRGTFIISAYDNEGAISYPAAFPFVIGVDMSNNRLKHNEFEYVENSIVNVRGSSSYHRVLWKDKQTLLVQGASFSSVYVSLKVLELIKEGVTSYDCLLYQLSKCAKKKFCAPPKIDYETGFISAIKRAIVFPFNKENHSLLRYRTLLSFQVYGVYDSKYSFNVGKRVCDLQPDIRCDEIINDIESVDWNDDFDTVILGHVGLLSEISGINYKEKIISKCCLHNKRIVSYDLISEGCPVKNYTPYISESMVPSNRFGKLRQISIPVLGIWGTSSQQGKFTLQLKIRDELNRCGYKVGWLSTEPQGSLFLAERVYPIGYSSTVFISDMSAVLLLNEFMWDIERENCDLIIVGSQSGTIPYTTTNLASYPIYQNDILYATQPDYVLLCINPYDEYEYIYRTIKYIEGAIDTKVVGLVLFPNVLKEKNIFHGLVKQTLNSEEMQSKIKGLEEEFGVKVYSANASGISQDIISLFT